LENEEIQERDHGPTNPSYGEKMQLRNLEDVRVKTLATDTIQQPLVPHIGGASKRPCRRVVIKSDTTLHGDADK
jgi:hypothetical protein